ncbi:Acyltransferase family [Mycobacteroides abscessus subsp. abscessus]|nr:Acyltransferase family [Mycobacteroides abscessus subsp. abscessus]
MELSKKDMNILKGVAILMMLLLHLFCRKEIGNLYKVFIYIDEIPLLYYIALFGDSCVPIYCFASGYGLYITYIEKYRSFKRNNLIRLIILMINFWIILILFVSIGYIFAPNIYPNSGKIFVLNMILLSSSYNGAWWFLQTYVLLVIISPYLMKIIKARHSILVLLISGFIYFITYLQRIKHIIDFGDNEIINILVNSTVLLGTSLLPFVIGSIFAKERIYSKVYNFMYQIKYKNIICTFGIISLIVFHSFVETMFVAPFIAIIFTCLFNVMKKPYILQSVLDYFGKHSTNIWLTHMFFYMTIFPNLTFAPRYPFFIFVWLIVLCIVTSQIINILMNQVTKVIKQTHNNRDTKVA